MLKEEKRVANGNLTNKSHFNLKQVNLIYTARPCRTISDLEKKKFKTDEFINYCYFFLLNEK